MNRRDLLRAFAAASCCPAFVLDTLAARPADSPEIAPKAESFPLKIGAGPQLFLDDFLIDRLEGLQRKVQHPERLAKPVLDSKSRCCRNCHPSRRACRERRQPRHCSL